MSKDIPAGDVPILEGYVGNLSSEQSQKLKEMWEQFFEAISKNDKEVDASELKGGRSGPTANDDGDNDPSKSGIPKNDAAKDEAKKREERKEFTEMIETYGSRKLRETFWQFNKGDNPDTSMLRFLRARKWDVDRALAMLGSCMKWRIENEVEEMVEKGELGCGAEIPKFLEQGGTGKVYAQGTSGNEQPITYIHVGKHRTFGQPSSTMAKYVIFSMETYRLFMVPPNDKVVLLFDLTGFGLACMDWNCILFVVKCLESYYPESLGTLYIHNSPLIFKGCWMILRPLLDPVVRDKVKFTYKPDDLKERIPSERLITTLGGDQKFDWVFNGPKEGENDHLKDKEARKKAWDKYLEIATQFEEVTRKATFKKGDPTAKERDVLVKKLRIQNFELEKHIRGLTVYHRQGIIRGDGVVTWQYPQKNGEVLRHSVGHRFSAKALQQQIDEDLTADEWQEKYGEAFNKRLRRAEDGEDEEDEPEDEDEDEDEDESDEDSESESDDDDDDRLDVERQLGPKPGKFKVLASKVTKGPSALEKREAEKQRIIKKHEEKLRQKKKEKQEREERERQRQRQRRKEELEKRRQQEQENGKQVNGTANGTANGHANGSPNGSAKASLNGSTNGSVNGSTKGGYFGGLKMAALSVGNRAADYTPAALGGNRLKEATSGANGAANGEAH